MSASKSLKSRLQGDLSTAIKARDELTSATLRMTLAAVTTEEVAGKQARELSDDEVVKVIGREAKKRREAAEAFEKGGRPEQAARERAEGEVLAAYLPAQLSDAELDELVAAAVAQARAEGAEGPRAMGAVMKLVNPRVAGRAEGGRVAAAVKRALAGA
ncbi:GatB/YqeY domain-containing protein [Streptomyces sp. DSM 44917]|uniref:GatB/YqeY domain-containing protein n=1 Tax=Streptomyces boetiae TaxID=3075541 RepID=A0ABU2LA77_9ACTN|nr:GatB/YqeY domain-containing protein [Streptomyces sp. DSM 44917]MDT0308480.1 GatB/YqeY domain-containing protein [Streptomyces sp. DSM 44917]